MVERVPQHRHCKECDRAVPSKDEFCDEKCEAAWKGKMKAKKRQLMYFYMLLVAIMIITIVLGFMG